MSDKHCLANCLVDFMRVIIGSWFVGSFVVFVVFVVPCVEITVTEILTSTALYYVRHTAQGLI